MFTAEQYRAKAAEFSAFLTNTPRSPKETSEFRDLEQTYTTLAENEEWMAVHLDKTIQQRKNSENRTALAEEEEQILKCLGAAVLNALEYCSHEAPTGALRLRQYNRGSAANNAAQGTDSSLPSQS